MCLTEQLPSTAWKKREYIIFNPLHSQWISEVEELCLGETSGPGVGVSAATDLLVTRSRMQGFPGGAMVKNLPANAGDAWYASLILRLGRSPEVGNGNPLQYSCLENSMNRGTWKATVHRIAKGGHNCQVRAAGEVGGEKELEVKCWLLLVTPQTVAYQAPLSIEFFRQEYWRG